MSLTQSPVYTATAQLQFRDPLADLNIVGIGGESVPELAPNQRSATNAELVTRPEVTRKVIETLDTSVSSGGLSSSIAGRVSPQTNLVILEASWGDAQFAADLANAYAQAAKDVAVEDFRSRLGRFEDALSERLKAARENLPKPGEPVTDPGLSFTVATLGQNLANVRSLAEVAEPVQIAQRAEVPGSPVSPAPVRDGILGLVVGFVLALIIAFIRDSLDHRLHSAQDVHDEMDVPVLGRVGAAAFAHPGLAKNGRPAILENEFEPFRVLRMNLGFLADEGGAAPRSVLVTSPLAGEGKSTVSVSLASAAALAGQKVLLLECDLRKPSLARRLDIDRGPGLADYLAGKVGPGEILQIVPITEPRRLGEPTSKAPVGVTVKGDANGSVSVLEKEEGSKDKPGRVNDPTKVANGTGPSMVCVTAGAPVANSPELLRSERFRGMLDKITRAYDLVILDGSPLLAVADPLEVVPLVDGVLVCVRAQQTTREQVRAVKSALGHLPERPTGAVLTGLRPGDESYGYYYGY